MACQEKSVQIRTGNTAAASLLGLAEEAEQNGHSRQDEETSTSYLQGSIESGVVSGFQLATANGPLCDEPMWGLVFEVQTSHKT